VEAKPEYGYNLFIHGALNIVSPFLGMYYHQQKKIYDNWKNYFVDPEWEQLGETNSCQRARENVEAMMVEYGDGARAEVYVAWQGGGAHVFIAENINGEIVFMDPQTGDTDVADYFDDSIMISESVMICRMDDRQLSNYGRQCVKKSSDSHED